MIEEWRDIDGYEGIYQVSDQGRIRSFKSGEWVDRKPYEKEKGADYLRINLHKDGTTKTYRLHRLVWETFNGPIPEGYVCNHINEDKKDCRLCNLNLLTHKENVNWGTGIKRRVETYKRNLRRVVQQLTEEGELVQEYDLPIDVERTLGFSRKTIANSCRGEKGYEKPYGYIWRYAYK